jgi:glycosyltransferase involved in cell wall biosynthesis
MTVSGRAALVSVVVASYNHAEYLVQRMDTLLAQTYRDIEIIVIEDVSPDNSLEVLRRYQENPLVQLIVRERNGGWVKVSNQGIELARGEFIMFANCDDACLPQLIGRLVLALDANPSAGIAFCRSLLVDENDCILGEDFPRREPAFRRFCAADSLISGAQMSRFLLNSCVIPNLSAALFRKKCLVEAGGFSSEYRVCSDWDLFFRIAARSDVAYVSTPLNRFRQHSTTIRSITKEKVVNEEYLRLLLGSMGRLELSFAERCRYRTHIMYLWAVYLVSPSWSGLRNFPYHLRKVIEFDVFALPFFFPALALRAGSLLGKALHRAPHAFEALRRE